MNINKEIIEMDEEFRYTTEPVSRSDLYELYEKARESQWVPDEIKEDMEKDSKGWSKLSEKEQYFIKHIVAFFAVSDGVVIETLDEQISSRIKIREAKIWYNHQKMMEDIHGIVYSKLVNIYFDDLKERDEVFKSIATYPTIINKINWIKKWTGDKNVQLGQVIIANAITEGVFFSGSFAAIFWVNHYYNGLLPGLSKANEWISKDEHGHTEFAIVLYNNYIEHKCNEKLIIEMFTEAVEIESEFIRDALPEPLNGMNSSLMIDYIKFVADELLTELHYNKIFNVKNPFQHILKLSINPGYADFFGVDVADYGLEKNDGFGITDSKIDEDF